MKILWKTYFWLFTVLHLLSFIIVLFMNFDDTELIETEVNFFSIGYDIFILLIGFFGFVGLYGYVFRKTFLSQDVWKFVFLLILIETIGNLTYHLLEKNYDFMIEGLIYIPFFYALYSYAFKPEPSKVAANG